MYFRSSSICGADDGDGQVREGASCTGVDILAAHWREASIRRMESSLRDAAGKASHATSGCLPPHLSQPCKGIATTRLVSA